MAVTVPAGAQQPNQAQQMAYARAFNGNWFSVNGSTIALSNDGNEIRAKFVRPSQAAVQARVQPGAEALRGQFNGPNITGFGLYYSQSAAFQQQCRSSSYWRPISGKANFERDRIDITVHPHLVTVENGRCVVVDGQKDPNKFRQLAQYGQLIMVPQASTYVLQKEGGAPGAPGQQQGAQVNPGPPGAACPGERASPGGSTQARWSVTNGANAVRKVFWLNGQGQRQLFATLQPGQSYSANTFLNHVWVTTNAANNCVSIFVVDRPQASYTLN